MPGLDNANPIIFRPSQRSVRPSELEKLTLWDGLVDEETIDNSAFSETNPEPIDEQEVFGE